MTRPSLDADRERGRDDGSTWGAAGAHGRARPPFVRTSTRSESCFATAAASRSRPLDCFWTRSRASTLRERPSSGKRGGSPPPSGATAASPGPRDADNVARTPSLAPRLCSAWRRSPDRRGGWHLQLALDSDDDRSRRDPGDDAAAPAGGALPGGDRTASRNPSRRQCPNPSRKPGAGADRAHLRRARGAEEGDRRREEGCREGSQVRQGGEGGDQDGGRGAQESDRGAAEGLRQVERTPAWTSFRAPEQFIARWFGRDTWPSRPSASAIASWRDTSTAATYFVGAATATSRRTGIVNLGGFGLGDGSLFPDAVDRPRRPGPGEQRAHRSARDGLRRRRAGDRHRRHRDAGDVRRLPGRPVRPAGHRAGSRSSKGAAGRPHPDRVRPHALRARHDRRLGRRPRPSTSSTSTTRRSRRSWTATPRAAWRTSAPATPTHPTSSTTSPAPRRSTRTSEPDYPGPEVCATPGKDGMFRVLQATDANRAGRHDLHGVRRARDRRRRRRPARRLAAVPVGPHDRALRRRRPGDGGRDRRDAAVPPRVLVHEEANPGYGTASRASRRSSRTTSRTSRRRSPRPSP